MKTNGKIALGVVGVGVLFGLAWMIGDEESSAGGSSSGGPGTATLEETAATLRAQYLEVVDGCTINWKAPGSQVGLESHVTDFFSPAFARAINGGALTVDAITIAITQLLVPGCPQPPSPLAELDSIDAALLGELGTVQQQMFELGRAYAAVQLYLAVRAIVSTLSAAQEQR